jgi:hypothetical protein
MSTLSINSSGLITSGSSIISGSLNISGSGTLNNCLLLTSCQTGSFITTGSNSLNGTQTITGSLLVSGSTTQIGNNTLTGDTILSGSLTVSGSTNFRNSIFIVTGSQYFTGSSEFIGNQTITGSLGITGTFTFSGSLFVNGNKQFNYGNFYSTQSQSNPVGNVSRSVYVETDAGSVGVSVVSQSRITVQNTGVYNLQFSTQFEKTNNGVDIAYVWFKKNGVNIPDSATSLDITKQAGGGGRAVAAWNVVIPLSASNYVEIVWQAADTTIQIAYDVASGNVPAIPSTIATLTQIA